MPNLAPFADLELSLRRWSGDDYSLEARFHLSASAAEAQLLPGSPPRVRIPFETLLESSLDASAYGQQLGQALFTDPRIVQRLYYEELSRRERADLHRRAAVICPARPRAYLLGDDGAPDRPEQLDPRPDHSARGQPRRPALPERPRPGLCRLRAGEPGQPDSAGACTAGLLAA